MFFDQLMRMGTGRDGGGRGESRRTARHALWRWFSILIVCLCGTALTPPCAAAADADGPYLLQVQWEESGVAFEAIGLELEAPRRDREAWRARPTATVQVDGKSIGSLPLAVFPTAPTLAGVPVFRANVVCHKSRYGSGRKATVSPDPRVLVETNPADVTADYWPVLVLDPHGQPIRKGRLEITWRHEDGDGIQAFAFGPAPLRPGRFAGTLDGRPLRNDFRWEKRSLAGESAALGWVLVVSYDVPQQVDPGTYSVRVIGGQGGRACKPGASVRIVADPAPAGQSFDRWLSPDHVVFANERAAVTTFTMPNRPVTAVATYCAEGPLLTVQAGRGGGRSAPGATVAIVANPAPEGQVFDRWSGPQDVAFMDATAAGTTFTMPNHDVTVTATYRAVGRLLTVLGGKGGGRHTPGTTVTVTADPPPQGKQFVSWISGDEVAFRDDGVPVTTLTMPDRDVTVTARFGTPAPTAFLLTVRDGAGGGRHAAGGRVQIALSRRAPSGKRFARWECTGGVLADPLATSTLFTMPGHDVEVRAVFEVAYGLQLRNGRTTDGKAAGQFVKGEGVSIVADTPPAGKRFLAWRASAGELVQPGERRTIFYMPGQKAVVEATYEVPPPPTHRLTVKGGAGSGEYSAGTQVEIRAGAPPAGRQFARWDRTAGALVDSAAATTFFTMPPRDAVLTAVYEVPPPPAFRLTVKQGSGSGRYAAGQTVEVKAETAPRGRRFAAWKGPENVFADRGAPQTTVTMPAADVVAEAAYETAHVLLVLSDGIRMRAPDRKWFSLAQMSSLEIARNVPGYTMAIFAGRDAHIRDAAAPPLMRAAETGRESKELLDALRQAGTSGRGSDPQRLAEMLEAVPELVRNSGLKTPHVVVVSSTEWSSDDASLNADSLPWKDILRSVDHLTVLHLDKDKDSLRPEYEQFLGNFLAKDPRLQRRLLFLPPRSEHADAIASALQELLTSGFAGAAP